MHFRKGFDIMLPKNEWGQTTSINFFSPTSMGGCSKHNHPIYKYENTFSRFSCVFQSPTSVRKYSKHNYEVYKYENMCNKPNCLKPKITVGQLNRGRFKRFSSFWPVFPVVDRFWNFWLFSINWTGWGSGFRFNRSDRPVRSGFQNYAQDNLSPTLPLEFPTNTS